MAPVHTGFQQWVEKYRPRQVKDVAHQEEVVRALSRTLETGCLPHLLFYGPPGTGKTTTALAIAHQLFGTELYKSRVLELNASDDRGINVVRTEIKDFAAVAVASGSTNSGYLCPPFKIIILDEADSMTEDAQSAARLYGSSISSNDIISVSGVVQSLFQACKTGQFDVAQKEVADITAEGHPTSQIFSQLYDMVVQASDISDETKAQISRRLAEADKAISSHHQIS